MRASRRPPPPAASASGLFECLTVLAEEARALGLVDAARTIRMAADVVALEAEEKHLAAAQVTPRRGDTLAG